MKILFRGQLMLLMTIIIKSIWKYIFSTNTDTPISASTCAHLHGVDGRLCCGSSQRSSHEPLVGLDLPWFTGQHLLILMEHSDKGALHQNYASQCEGQLIVTKRLFVSTVNNFIWNCILKGHHQMNCASQSLSFILCSVFKEVKYLLVGHKFNGSLRGDLQHVDTVSSPQRHQASFFQHLLETTNQTDFVALGGMHLYIKTACKCKSLFLSFI